MEPEGLQLGSALLGRERECQAIDRLLRAAVRGESGTLVLRGDPGIGKSVLLDYAAEHAGDSLVLRITGVEAESDLAFAGLYGLIRPVVAKVDELPERQSAALSGALGLGPSVEADRLLVSAAVLGVLAAAAEERPLVCVVDDAQWLDKPSADALMFAARRLVAERVAMLFAVREDEELRFEAHGLPELVLAGLDPQIAARLLERCVSYAAPNVRERLILEAGGNPLALLELPSGLTERQRTGRRDALPEAIPLSPRLKQVFRRRVEDLTQSAQIGLMLLAADDTGDAATILRAAAEMGLPSDALDVAEAEGLIRSSLDRMSFRHPLVRAAVYDAATLSERRRAHASLAATLDGEEHADRRVWHQAMATLTGDEEVAGALELSAHRARLRSAHASAATAYLRAADLSTDADTRTSRLAAAAQAAWDGGQPDRARQAIGEALPLADGALRAQLLYLRGTIESRRQRAAGRRVAARGGTCHYRPVVEVRDPGRGGRGRRIRGRAGSSSGRLASSDADSTCDRRDRFLLASGQGWVAVWARDHATAEAAFADALQCATALEDPRTLVWAADAALAAIGFGAGLPYANRDVEMTREQGLLSLLPMALHRQALALQWNSLFDRAYAAAQEGYQLARDVGYGVGTHLASMAFVEAVRGRAEEARAHAEEAFAIGQRSGSNLLADTAELTIGFVELARGRLDAAFDRLSALTAAERPRGHRLISLTAVPDFVEVATRIGRERDATEPLERYAAWVSGSRSEPGQALLARCRCSDERRQRGRGIRRSNRPCRSALTLRAQPDEAAVRRMASPAATPRGRSPAPARGPGALPWPRRGPLGGANRSGAPRHR
jgi:AAA ATPase domain